MGTAAIWLDFETTGLVAERDHVLEVGMTAVSATLEVLDEYHAVLAYDGPPMIPFIVDMHTKNGLLNDVKMSGQLKSIVSAEMAEFVVKHFPHEKAILGGDSVHFDVGFLKFHFPVVAKLVSHRLIDVSSIAAAKRLFSGVADPKQDVAHRSLADNRQSIERLKRLLG